MKTQKVSVLTVVLLASSALAVMSTDPVKEYTRQGSDFSLERRSGLQRTRDGGTLQTYTLLYNGKLSLKTPFKNTAPIRFKLTLLAHRDDPNLVELRLNYQGWLNPAWSYSTGYWIGKFLGRCVSPAEGTLEQVVTFVGASVLPNSSATATKTFKGITVIQEVVYDKRRERSSVNVVVKSGLLGPTDSCMLEP